MVRYLSLFCLMISLILFYIVKYIFDHYTMMDIIEAPDRYEMGTSGTDCRFLKHAYAFECGFVSSRVCNFISKTTLELDLYFERVAESHSSAKTLKRWELDEMEKKVNSYSDMILAVSKLCVDDCPQHEKDKILLVNKIMADCNEQKMEFNVIKFTWHKMVSLHWIIDQGMISIADMNMFDDYLDNHYDETVNEMNRIYQSYFLPVCYELDYLDDFITAVGMDITTETKPRATRIILNDMSLSILAKIKLLQGQCKNYCLFIQKFRV